MKKILFILVVSLVSLSTVGITRAEEHPYVYISFKQKAVKLESNVIWDTVIPKALTLKVNSNCFHGSIIASMSSIKNSIGNRIERDRVYIKTLATGGFVPLSKPVAISRPMFGSHDIRVDFMVKANGVINRAGIYSGTIAFTIMPPA